MDKDAKIYIAGHKGLVGSALVRRLRGDGFGNLLLRSHRDLDLTDPSAVDRFFASEKPQYVFLAAAKVGGILANLTFPADFIRINLQIQLNVIDAAYKYGVRKLMFFGSSCIYPRQAPQPMREEYLLTGPLESTNEPYAIAKIAGIKICQAYRRQFGFNAISVMPTNLYGPGDDFESENSHVIPALLRKFHWAKEAHRKTVVVWGTGAPRREFLHVDDLADAAVFLMRTYESGDVINVGVGKDISIRELAELIAEVVGFDQEIAFDPSKPDGAPQKLLDVSRLFSMGWRPRIPLREGLKATYAWFREHCGRNVG